MYLSITHETPKPKLKSQAEPVFLFSERESRFRFEYKRCLHHHIGSPTVFCFFVYNSFESCSRIKSESRVRERVRNIITAVHNAMICCVFEWIIMLCHREKGEHFA